MKKFLNFLKFINNSDLNKELGKMKELLNDIVTKMSNTLGDSKSLLLNDEENSMLYDDRRSPHDGASVSYFFLSYDHKVSLFSKSFVSTS